jgi:glycine/D-amino acid oxidase-like deaminating enzyme
VAGKRVVVIGAGIALAILALSLGQAGAADLLIRNARLIDGTGAPPRTGVAILVRDSRIAPSLQNLPRLIPRSSTPGAQRCCPV